MASLRRALLAFKLLLFFEFAVPLRASNSDEDEEGSLPDPAEDEGNDDGESDEDSAEGAQGDMPPQGGVDPMMQKMQLPVYIDPTMGEDIREPDAAHRTKACLYLARSAVGAGQQDIGVKQASETLLAQGHPQQMHGDILVVSAYAQCYKDISETDVADLVVEETGELDFENPKFREVAQEMIGGGTLLTPHDPMTKISVQRFALLQTAIREEQAMLQKFHAAKMAAKQKPKKKRKNAASSSTASSGSFLDGWTGMLYIVIVIAILCAVTLWAIAMLNGFKGTKKSALGPSTKQKREMAKKEAATARRKMPTNK
ncbi:unnamed protein product [Amoebophrya sp. A25]|nr:unnamed protein product [Amoebophrya sp. A25]|eukprot:GSA25T00023479001.1